MKHAVRGNQVLIVPVLNVRVLAAWAVATCVLGFQGVAHAHPESVSNLRLTLSATGLRAVMTLPTRDLTRWFPPGRYSNYLPDVVKELQTQAGSLLEVRWDDVVVPATVANVHRGLTGFIVAELSYAVPEGAASIQVRSTCIGNLPNDHQQLTSIQDDRGPGGRILVDEALSAQQDALSVDLPTVAPGGVAPVNSTTALVPPPPAPVMAGALQTPQPAGDMHHLILFTTIVAVVVFVGLIGLLRIGFKFPPRRAVPARVSNVGGGP